MTHTTSRRTPPSESILEEWRLHNPFERASAELIRRAQEYERQGKKQQVMDSEAALL
jgi:hypothetical protein